MTDKLDNLEELNYNSELEGDSESNNEAENTLDSVDDGALGESEDSEVEARSDDSSESELPKSPEDEAREKGWDPEKGPLSAEEYLGRGPLYKTINSQKKLIKKLQSRMDALAELMLKQNEQKHSDDRAYFENIVNSSDDPDEVRAAFKALKAVEEKEASLNSYKPQEEAKSSLPEDTMEFLTSRPEWFPNAVNKNVTLTQKQIQIQQFAMQREAELQSKYPDAELSDIYTVLEKEIISKFESPKKQKTIKSPESVKPSTSSKSASADHDVSSLNSFDRAMYAKLVKSGLVDKETFFESLKTRGQ